MKRYAAGDLAKSFNLGELIEFDKTDTIFITPKMDLTTNYITGRFG